VTDTPAAPAESLLLIVPPAAHATRGLSAHTPVLGLPLLRRIVLAGNRAGLRPVVSLPVLHGPERLLTGAATTDPAAREAMWPPRRIVICPANVLVQADWLRELSTRPIEPEVLYVDDSMVGLLETKDSPRVLAAAGCARTADELFGALERWMPRTPSRLDRGGRFALSRSEDLLAAETWLLRSLIKPHEGFMSRHVERRVSLGITRRLVDTPVTPSAITLTSVAIGLLSAPFFLSARPAWQLVGALIFLLHSILDGCDGELARLKFLDSRAGAILDFWGDNVVHVAVFTCMTLGWTWASRSPWPLAVGAAAIASVGIATIVLSRRGLGPQASAGASRAARIVDSLGNRDFIYLVLALAAFGQAWWFLALVATGTPLFVLLALQATRRQPA